VRLAYLLAAPGIPVQGPSGSSAHVRGLVGALREEHQVALYALKKSDRRGRFGAPTEAVITGIGGWPSWLSSSREIREMLAARRLARRVMADAWRDQSPQLFIERHSLFSDAGWRVATRLDVPLVLEVNAPLAIERERFEELRRPAWAVRWERDVLQAAPAIVAVSRWLVDWLRQEMGCRNVRWVPNGVVPIRGDPVRGRKALGLGPDDFAVGFLGSMKPWHGVERLGAIARGAEARLVLLGEAGDIPDLPEDTVRTGHLDGQEVADAVAALDVGLAPYPEDAPPWFCPLKVLDYRAQGTPVVASDVGDVGELAGVGGTVVPPGDLDGFIDAVKAWRGRALRPRVRSWGRVATEVLRAGGLGKPLPSRHSTDPSRPGARLGSDV